MLPGTKIRCCSPNTIKIKPCFSGMIPTPSPKKTKQKKITLKIYKIQIAVNKGIHRAATFFPQGFPV